MSQTVFQKIVRMVCGLFLMVLFVMPVAVSAQATADDPFRLQESDFANTVNLGRLDLMSIIANGIQIFLGILGIIVVIIFLYAGWMWMTSNGDEEKIGTAKKMMINATIGLGIILASFAITEFIIRKLTEATGFNPELNCTDPSYATAFPERCDDGDTLPDYCETNPTVAACLGDVFLVKSITPVTNSTGMNNVVVRVVFSKSVVIDTESPIRIYRGDVDITNDFSLSWVGSNRVLEAVYDEASGMLPPATYRVVVQSSVRSVDEESLEDTVDGEEYPLEAQFIVTTDGITDTEAPVVSVVKINGNESARHIIKRGTSPLITANISDDHGVGFARFALQRFDAATLSDISFEGPRVVDGSDATSANPFEYASSWLFASNMSVPAMYTANLIAKDIDSNTSVAYTTEVVVVGQSCNALGGSNDPSTPDNSCLAEPGGPCSADWQCASGVCDEGAGVCLPYPVILDVSPWSGAAGNMVTVMGTYFGEDVGSVYFGFDANSDTVISTAEWVPAVLPSLECPDVDLWTDNWAIVKVPNNDVLPMDSLSAVRVVRGDGTGYEDTTINTRGPKANDVGFPGYFRVTNDSYPGLCSVKTLEGATEAKPEVTIVARGLGFGSDRGQILFGGRPGTSVAEWSNFSAQARIPANLLPGLIPVRVVDRNEKQSNSVPFRIRRADEDVLPVIEFIDPTPTTRQSFMTISGARFGASVGRVWISQNGDDIERCGQGEGDRPSSCIELSYGGYDFCAADWWSTKQIFAYIPEALDLGTYFVLVQTASGLQTSGDDTFDVVSGAPRPSICSLKPDNGPAPLPAGASLELRGINFFTPGAPIVNNNTTGYFWRSGASATDPVGTWLSTLPISNPSSTILRTLSNSTTIKTTIPVLSSGVTMQTGPIVIAGSYSGFNVFQNADFENFPGWIQTPPSAVAGMPLGVSPGHALIDGLVSARSGQLVGRIDITGFAVSPARISQVVSNLDVGSSYNVSFYGKRYVSGLDADVVVAAAGNSVEVASSTISVTSDAWQLYTFNFVASASEMTISWYMNVPGSGAIERGVYLDDVTLLPAVSLNTLSNRVTYTVNDCRTDRSSSMPGYQCCTEGPEAGVWKSGDAVCEGQTRDSGYVWRFTTGKLSNRPRVVEECRVDGDIPSPVPSTLPVDNLYLVGQNACVNQMVVVRFDVSEDTVMVDGVTAPNSAENPSNVSLYTCGTGAALRESDCEAEIALTPRLEGNVLTIYDAGTDHLENNTWYKVALSKNIQGLSLVSELGSTREELVSLLSTRPCTQDGKEYAYCFEFKTSELGETCTLVGAGITPREQRARILGRVSDVFGNAILFSVFGRGNQECTVLNVDRLGWSWIDEQTAVVEAIPKAAPRSENDSKANADARQITTEAGSDIFASVLLPQLIVPSVRIPSGVTLPKGIRETRFQSGDINVTGCSVSIGGSVFVVSSSVRTPDCLLDGALFDVVPVGDEYNQLKIAASTLQPYMQRSIIAADESFWSPFRDSSFTLSLTTQLDNTIGSGQEAHLYHFSHYETAPSEPTELFHLAVTSGNRIRASLQYPSADGSGTVLTPSLETTRALAKDTLYHIAFTYDRPSGRAALYVNGQEWASTTLVNVPTKTTSNTLGLYGTVSLGNVYGTFTDPFHVSFGHVGLYESALSSEAVRIFSDIVRGVSMPGSGGLRTITATSTIIVNPGKPKVVDYWPRCTEACVNAGLGATFNRPMVTSTYVGNYVISRCADGELCTPGSRVSIPNTTITLDTQQSDSQRIVFNLQGTNTFATNTWYVVSLTDGIRAYAGSDTLLGDTLEPFNWKFRTKSDGTLCTLSSSRVLPLSFVANVQYQKTLYSAQALSEPDTCSPQGQVLNPWFFDWSWSSADERVATVSNIKSGGTYYPWCTSSCLPAGSMIARTTSTPAMCGDGVVGDGVAANGSEGEDCDIAAAGEVPGVSCTFSCLRPGNEASTCGDGVVSTALGEECDAGGRTTSSAYAGDEFCSSICTNKGSSSDPTGRVIGSICGSGTVTKGEECEVGQSGCTNQCLRAGTSLSRAWCDAGGYSTTTIRSVSMDACKNAVSVCGNGEIESGEACEIGVGDGTAANCSDSCLVKAGVNVCETSLSQCAGRGVAGCSAECTLLGASVSYINPSVCGDVAVGAVTSGKDLSCQVAVRGETGVIAKNGLPVQAVTAIGMGDLASTTAQYQQTVISATALNTGAEAGEGEYFYQCGYTEYSSAPAPGKYNNCVDPTQGVGVNSCCYARPVRVDEYPAQGQTGVCRNTAITAYMKGYIDQETLSDNVRLVAYYAGATSCPAGLADVTSEYTDESIFSIAKNTLAPLPVDANIFERVWYRIKTFVVRLFGESASADITDGKLCAGIPIAGSVTFVGDGTYANTTSTIRLQIGAALRPSTDYYVTLDGGNNGIKDVFGVGMKHPTVTSTLSDAWRFRTGEEICKLDSVIVQPSTKLFRSPNTTSTFIARGKTSDNQLIESIDGVYAYEWMWVPGGNPLFDVPVAGSERLNTSTVDIASKNIEGTLSASAVAIVTTDTDTTRESHVNRSFSGQTLLTSLFCNNVWPPEVGGEWNFFEDTDYHFRSFYCADAGTLGVTTDDLPLMSVVAYTDSGDVFGGAPIPGAITDEDVIRRYLLVSDKNDDVIGVQILSNPDGKSVSEWYQGRFGSLSQQRVVIDGYEALTNGDTFYIGAYNQVTTTPNRLYNNIYVVTINQGAQTNTRAVLDQFIRNLKFNTNIYDDQYCLEDDTSRILSGISCTTDFDCRSANGTALSGLSGVCGNDRTKLFNDLKRLQDIGAFQRAVNKYKTANNGTVPAVAAGTYYPSYTNSMWPSWQATLGGSDALSAALPRDPVNRWTQCGVEGINAQTCWDQASSTYACPAFSQIYEYKRTSTSSYMFHAGFEYLDSSIENAYGDPFIEGFVDTSLISQTPWCVGEVRSPFGASCGDRIVQPSEVCEIGQTEVVQDEISPGVWGSISRTCAADCRSWVQSGTSAQVTCGNGIVESSALATVPSEFCDDGAALNGTYGQCAGPNSVAGNPAAACQQAHPQYCGNGSLDRLSATQPLEYCDNTSAGVCEYVTESGVKITPKVHIILDRSGSMAFCPDGTNSGFARTCSGVSNNFTGSRWEAAVAALQSLYSQTSGDVDYTLRYFSGTNRTPDVCSYEDSFASLSSVTPLDGTPTYNALFDTYANREVLFEGDQSVPKMVILITDGAPSDVAGCTGNTTSSVRAQIERLRLYGVKTYVVGFGNLPSTDQEIMTKFAQSGGTDESYFADSSAELVSAIKSILSCSPYSATKAGSCAYDCQSVGSYCGDGVTDLQFGEECDDANTVPNDACDNTCRTVVNPQAPTRDPGRKFCGDAVRDWDDRNNNNVKDSGENWIEACDTGATQLGKRPDPNSIPYGEVRTYCSVDCQDILTVDSAARCGNGKRDFNDLNGDGVAQVGEWIEACDSLSGGGVTRSADGTAVAGCSDMGSRTCENSCQTYVDNCVTCVADETPDSTGYAFPYFAVLNPMIENPSSEYGRLWADQVVPYLYRPTYEAGSELRGFLLGRAQLSEYPQFFSQSQHIGRDETARETKINTAAACSEEYVIAFNTNQAGMNVNGPFPDKSTRKSSVFPYPVSGELGIVKNEYVLSPAVPTGTYRVVVRWTDEEENKGVQFVGGVYSEAFPAPASFNYVNLPRVGDWDMKCGSVTTTNSLYPGFWWPNTGTCYGMPNNSTNKVVYTHRILGLEKTFVQSMTIDTTQMRSTGSESIAVYVSAIHSNLESSIQGLKNSNLVVDVYSARPDQDPMYSIYSPSTTLSIKNAARSSNPDAQYWHVFNLEKVGSEYQIRPPTSTMPNGVIVTDLDQIRKRTKNDSRYDSAY